PIATALLGRRPTMMVSTMPMLLQPSSAKMRGKASRSVWRNSAHITDVLSARAALTFMRCGPPQVRLTSPAVGLVSVTTMEQEDTNSQESRVGLCHRCVHSKVITSDRGSRFYFCQLSANYPETFPKYPRLPVLECSGYEPTDSSG